MAHLSDESFDTGFTRTEEVLSVNQHAYLSGVLSKKNGQYVLTYSENCKLTISSKELKSLNVCLFFNGFFNGLETKSIEWLTVHSGRYWLACRRIHSLFLCLTFSFQILLTNTCFQTYTTRQNYVNELKLHALFLSNNSLDQRIKRRILHRIIPTRWKYHAQFLINRSCNDRIGIWGFYLYRIHHLGYWRKVNERLGWEKHGRRISKRNIAIPTNNSTNL